MSGPKVGMLWFDNDPKTSTAMKIAHAVAYYERKYGVRAEWVECNPAQMSGDLAQRIVDELKIKVRVNSQVLPNHYWIGEVEA